jgi:F-type H+-transporting ATPase subunit gamma
MSTGKEIRQKIASVKNTQKITKAMEMVSTSKMRRTKDNMQKSRPYAEKIMQIIGHLSSSHPEYKHPFLQQRDDVKTVGLLIVTSDRGLCGGLNANLFRAVIREIKQYKDQGKEVKLCLIGGKGLSFFNSVGGEVLASCNGLGDNPSLSQILGVVSSTTKAFIEGEIDKVVLCSNVFVNTMTQQPTLTQLLPTEPNETAQEGHWDYIYEPDSQVVLDQLLNRYIENLVYKALIENIACEQSARMIAMKSATDNASGMIDDLNLAYNKARQSAITQELSEIIGGAAAV